ncbi:MAG TPA: PEP-CTERM sorting domain-containing protein [Pseudomonadales bacterium]|nr:PEP-CTERM sorting domain-containing protein [Pseudomonadales bacterium]
MITKIISSKTQLVLAIGTLFCAIALPRAEAQYSYIDQNTTTFGLNGCAPTASANALVYLDGLYAENIPNLFLNNSVLQTANQLGADMSTSATLGTAPANRDAGLSTYFTTQNTTVSIVGGQAPAALGVTVPAVQRQNPNAMYMENALANNDAVIFGQYWGSQAQVQATTSPFGATGNGGHVLTLLAMSGTTNGSITFEDPSGPKEVDNLSWTTVNGFIFVSGDPVQPADDGNDEGVDQGGTAYNSFAISDDVLLAVPEPSTGLLVGAGLLVPVGIRYFRKARRTII